MIKIIRNSLLSKIIAPTMTLIDVRKETAYIQEGFEHTKRGINGWDGKCYIIGSDGVFKTGFLKRITKALDTLGYSYELEDSLGEYSPELYNNFDYPLMPHQEDAILTAFKEKICLIDAATNSGKTYPIIATAIMADKAGLNVLITIHNKLVYKQIVTELEKHVKEVGQINDQLTNFAPITVAMEATLANRIKGQHWETYIEYLNNVQCILVDEVHRAGSGRYQSFLQHIENAENKIGFSGTSLEGSQENRLNIEGFFGSVAKTVSNREMMDKGVSSDVQVFFYSISDYANYNMPFKFAYKALMYSKQRLHICREILKEAPKNVLIVVDKYEHAEYIQKGLADGSFLMESKYPIIHGKLSMSEREELLTNFGQGNFEALITTSVLQEGVNIPNIRTIIYLTGLGKTAIKPKQFIGRGLRKKLEDNTLYFHDFYDLCKNLETHSETRLALYNTEGFKITKVNYSLLKGEGASRVNTPTNVGSSP